MNGMLRVMGDRVDARSLPRYTWNADLIFFDGPLLSLFKSEDHEDVLFCWLDSNDSKNRWCILPVARARLREYLGRSITLRDIFLEAESIIVFDSGAAGRRSGFVRTNSGAMPDEYLPAFDSYLYNEMATESAKKL